MRLLPDRPRAHPRPVESVKVKERGASDLEERFRRDPSNSVLAGELGIEYLARGRSHEALPLLLMAARALPRADVPRYYAALALLEVGRIPDAVKQLDYAFRLNALNVARFLKEGPAERHGSDPLVNQLLQKWARHYRDQSHRGYV